MSPRDAPMVCKGLSNHSIFPNRVPLERARTQLPLVGYSAPSFPRIVNSSGMIRTNKFASLKASCHALRQSTFASTLLFSCFAPRSSFLANSFHCGFWRSAMHSLLRLTRETRCFRGNNHDRDEILQRVCQLPIKPETHPVGGHKHVRKKK